MLKAYPRALLWVNSLGAIALMAACLWRIPEQAAVVISPGILALIGLSGVDRWMAVRAGQKESTP